MPYNHKAWNSVLFCNVHFADCVFSEEDGPRDVVVVSLCEGLHTAGLLGGYKGEVPERLPTRTRGKGIDYTSYSSPRAFPHRLGSPEWY